MRWEEPRDPARRPVPRLGIAAAAVTGLGVLLVAGAALSPGDPSTPRPGTMAVTEAVGEPTARGGLPHSIPSPRTSPTPVPAPSVADVAATVTAAPSTVTVPAAAPLVVRVGQPCGGAGATAITADGAPVRCDGGKGNGAPRWRKA